jgi:hypothetical protein
MSIAVFQVVLTSLLMLVILRPDIAIGIRSLEESAVPCRDRRSVPDLTGRGR